jgi:gliding motility-associated-like protein
MPKSLISLVATICIAIISFGQEVTHSEGVYKFLENKGQWPAHVNFKADVPGGNIWLEKNRIIYQFYERHDAHSHIGGLDHGKEIEYEFREHLIYAKFLGANNNPTLEKNKRTPEYYNFFKGNDRSKWATDVKAYKEVVYEDLYDGIDLVFFEKEGALKYEYILDPGTDAAQIQLKYFGATKVKKNKAGGITVKGALGEIIEEKPYAYQIKNGRIVEVPSEFEVSEDHVLTISLGDYDPSLELVIDPVLIFATYSGAPTDNFGMTATYAYDGKAYSAGMVFGNDYPAPAPAWSSTPNITNPNNGLQTTDAFVSKYSADGTNMIWTNFVGGGDNFQGTETVHSLICDTSNNIYMYGVTSSLDFPTSTGAYQPAFAGGDAALFNSTGTDFTPVGTDIYTVKISEDGLNFLGGTYIGGSNNDGINYTVTGAGFNYGSAATYDSLTTNYGDQFRGEIMLDSMNNVIIASNTRSTDFPTVNPIQPANGGQQDGVVFKLSADYTTLEWSTYFGGAENDGCYSVKIDSSFNIVFAGGTSSSDIPGTVGGLNPAYLGGEADGFIAKLTPDGQTLTQATYIGSNDYDQVFFIEVDRWDNIYVVGQTNGPMNIINAPYGVPNSGQFITKLEPDLNVLTYQTLFGNGDGDLDVSPSAFLVDVCGNVYVSGWGGMILPGGVPISGMPITTDAYQPNTVDGRDFYLFVMERDAQSLLYGSYLGDPAAGEHVDGGTSRFDKFGIVYQSVCGGCGGNQDFPTTPGAWSNDNLSSNCNNVIFKFDFEIVPEADFEISDIEGCAPFTFILDNESNDTINSVWTFPPEAIVVQGGVNPEILFTDPGQYEIILSITDTICNLQDTAVKVINVYDALQLDVMDDTVICDAVPITLWADSYGTGTSFLWYDDPGLTNQINAGGMDSTVTVTPTTTTTYYILASNGWPLCDILDSVTVFTAEGAVGLDDDLTMCLGDTLMFQATNLLPSETLTYSWSPPTGIINIDDSTVWVSPPSSMWYYLTATSGSGCVFYDSIYINVTNIDPALIYATASPDTIPAGGTSVLEAFPNVPGYEYYWFPPATLDTTFGQTVNASPDVTTEYIVTISGDGCEVATKTQVIIVEFVCEEGYIFIPNAFSPNGDNVNDVLYIRGSFLYDVDLKIFNRWGEKVFETTDQAVGWDGTYKGELVDPDVFVYHLTAFCFDGQERLIKGNITVLR